MCNHDWIECGDKKICLLCGEAVEVDEPAPSVTESRQKNQPINQVLHGDSLEVLKTLEDNSVDSIVTDPPYELGFMGKKWDSTGIAYNVELWKECLRALKPGGHLLAFGGTRTYHRMVCAIEDAGFEIRDCIQWIYGSGFPKSHDISKAIDKKFGAKREVVGYSSNPNGNSQGYTGERYSKKRQTKFGIVQDQPLKTAPSTNEAKQWDGWGTALKPANEPIVLARKPISEKTIAENVMKWGTGGLNIDGCRVGTEQITIRGGGAKYYDGYKSGLPNNSVNITNQGRFPANVILDEEAGKMLDEQSGYSKSTIGRRNPNGMRNGVNKNPEIYGEWNAQPDKISGYNDEGGASRFFYCAKASKKERGEGNNHPTVKPLSLIKYLITLVTPPEGVCLDPFEGSGTHALACEELGFNYIGFELDKEYYEIAKNRINKHIIDNNLQGKYSLIT